MSARGELEATIADALKLCGETEEAEGRSRALSLVRTKLEEARMWLTLGSEPQR